MTQTALGKSCQITAQQMCKYEQGHNSITAARLLEIADSLNTTPGAFLEGLKDASTYTKNN